MLMGDSPMLDATPAPARTQEGTSRRTIVRSAVAAAWAVPAISVASAAPAFASSGGGGTLQPPAGSTASTRLQRNGSAAVATVTLAVPAAGLPATSTVTISIPEAAFAAGAPSTTFTSRTASAFSVLIGDWALGTTWVTSGAHRTLTATLGTEITAGSGNIMIAFTMAYSSGGSATETKIPNATISTQVAGGGSHSVTLTGYGK
jgi:hypothetical protein